MTMRVPEGRGPTERSLLGEQTPLAERLTALPPVSLTECPALANPDFQKLLGLPDIPTDSKFRAKWDRRRKDAESEAAQLWLNVLAMPTGRIGDLINKYIAFWSGLFDIRAKALLVLIVPSAYPEVLNKHATAILAVLEQQPFDVVLSEMLVTRMADRLQQRLAYWTARRHAADQQLRARPAAAAPVVETKSNRRKRRAKMLADYMRDSGTQFPSWIYQDRRSGLHKPQYYQWLRGDLPSTSTMSIKLERFLANKQPAQDPKPGRDC